MHPAKQSRCEAKLQVRSFIPGSCRRSSANIFRGRGNVPSAELEGRTSPFLVTDAFLFSGRLIVRGLRTSRTGQGRIAIVTKRERDAVEANVPARVGEAARAPYPPYRPVRPLLSLPVDGNDIYPNSTASAPVTASAPPVMLFSSEGACTEMFSAKKRASVT